MYFGTSVTAFSFADRGGETFARPSGVFRLGSVGERLKSPRISLFVAVLHFGLRLL